jgi:hypothetical protein
MHTIPSLMTQNSPAPCGLMEQNKKRPRRGSEPCQGRSALWLWVQNPKGGTEYPVRTAGSNRAFAFMEPAEPLQPVLPDWRAHGKDVFDEACG